MKDGTVPLRPDDLVRLRVPADLQLTPDGSRLAFVLESLAKDKDEARACSAVHMTNVDTGHVTLFAGNDATATHSPRWSSNGRWLAVISNRANAHEEQLYVLDMRGGEA